MTHKTVIQLHVVAESWTICSSYSRQPVWKLLDTPSYILSPPTASKQAWELSWFTSHSYSRQILVQK